MPSWSLYISIVAFTIVAGLGWFSHPLSANAQVVTTVAGDGTSGFADGVGTAARFRYPRGVAVQGDSLFIADADNKNICAPIQHRAVGTAPGSAHRKGHTRLIRGGSRIKRGLADLSAICAAVVGRLYSGPGSNNGRGPNRGV